MKELFLYVALPYLSLVLLVGGTLYRLRQDAYGVSSFSTQILERKWIFWGSLPWHLGIFILLIGHAFPLLFPGVWQVFTGSFLFLWAVEALGVAAALSALMGATVLLVRRVTKEKLQAVSGVMELLVLVLLWLQVLLGLATAVHYRFGAAWAPGVLSPYLFSLFSFSPKPEYVQDLPPIIRLHLTLAWVIFALVPFSRLIHLFTVPVSFLWRAPQKVVWSTLPTTSAGRLQVAADESRRAFLKGGAALTVGGFLLGLGVLDKFIRFFRGPRMSLEEAQAFSKEKLARLEKTAEERRLELERMTLAYIPVAKLGELKKATGKYFIDYRMRPGLAFLSEEGLPHLLSAKCTHLGCTVGNKKNAQGKILCPCHVSYFDIQTGAPDPGSPAKRPLPVLGWALRDATGKIWMERKPNGEQKGELPERGRASLEVVLVREHEEEAG